MRILRNAAEQMGGSRLFTDYISNSEDTKEFYPSHFMDESSWQKVMDRVSGRKRDYSELAEILRRQNSALGSGQAAMDNIDKLADGNAFTVITGQQVGILTGPLYTIYKAMTVIKLAQHLSEKYEAEFIPVFWMESNDHDMEEANHVNILDSDSELIKLEYLPKSCTPGCSMKDVIVDDEFGDLVSDLEARLPNTEFKSDVFEIIRESYQLSQDIGRGFGRMMAQLLGKYGLVLFSPSDPDMKKLMSPILEREMNSPLKSMEIVNSAAERLKAMGYEPQIEKSQDSTGLFIEVDGIRRKLLFQDGHFRMDGNNENLESKALVDTLHAEPWAFSPNVALRPVIQDYISPTVAYVAGPGEISYFAQLAGLYEFMDVDMPIIYPRASFTIVESKVQRVMDKNELEVSDLSEHYDNLFSQLSKHTAAGKLEHLLESSNSEIRDILERLATGLMEFDPGLKNVVESAAKRIDHQLNILGERSYKAQRSRDDILRNQVKRACMNIYPDGKPQEREFNIVQYLVLYGLQFVDDLFSVIEL